MAKTKKEAKGSSAHTSAGNGQVANASARVNGNTSSSNGQSTQSPEQLYTTAVELAEQSQPKEALEVAKALLSIVQNRSPSESLPALNLLGEISLELGEPEQAHAYFQQAATIDPTGELEGPLAGGEEKFLWLAQLCEDGGRESVSWFEKGVTTLQRDIHALENGADLGIDPDTLLLMRAEKKAKLANALCGIVEVYMTDLSWDDDAEEKCESLITHAMTVEDETSPEVLQTLASVRLSQDRKEDAQAALRRSYESWKDLDADDEAVPEFAARISLARLLMEAELEEEALEVLDILVLEDDQSVEAWYLGGWCQWLLANKIEADAEDNHSTVLRGSRRWLKMSLKLYKLLDYEDDRLRDHAIELVEDLDSTLGLEHEGDEDQWEDEWDGIEDEADNGVEDEEMQDV